MASRAEREKFELRSMAHQYIPELDAFELYHREQDPSTVLGGPALPALGHAASGAVGAAISNAIIYPLALVITRLQVQRQLRAKSSAEGTEAIKDEVEAQYKDIVDAVQKIYKNEGGLKAFYAGIGQDVAKSVADSFLFFLAYNFLRGTRQRTKGTMNLPITDELGIGMVAGAFAKFFTTPVQNVVTRKQTAAMLANDPDSSVSPQLNTKDIALQIRHDKGILGFWAGYSASLVLTLNPGLTFVLHEAILRVLPKDKRSGPLATFAAAAVSKAIASAITYPFSVAKSRAQVSSKPPTERHVGGDISKDDSLSSAEEKVEQKVERNTVLGNVLSISKTEGPAALYQGLAGEILKGFFQHGITMLTKEQVNVVIVQSYYLLLKAMRKYPSPEELATIARERADRAAEDARIQGEKMVETGRSVISEAARLVTNPTGKGSIPAGDVYGKKS
ncbi:mitochondrial carrier [Rhizodiscina lignyota]|uniref:Mitochondrial carrier n=1 Tax=Rhizodiscina lignyota TaxID=1504668 RepID=A0A9P4MEJ4_9PEZI|nr:mitochondrial carrier [Rhizodiscina lignyota]